MSFIRCVTLFAIVFTVTACATVPMTTVPNSIPVTDKSFRNDPDDFQFAIVGDRTGGHRPGVFMDGVRKLNYLQPEFVLSIGDLIEGATEDEDELKRQWDEFDSFVNQLEMPFFYVAGNHDITNFYMRDKWQERFGPTYYHFLYKDVLFLCLNSEDPPASNQLSERQIDYFKRVLKEHPKVRWTLIFVHKPLWIEDPFPNSRWADFAGLLGNRQYTVFAGHLHKYIKTERRDRRHYILGTTGGMSRLRGPEYGEFDHVVWLTMTNQGPRIANLTLDGILAESVHTESDIAPE